MVLKKGKAFMTHIIFTSSSHSYLCENFLIEIFGRIHIVIGFYGTNIQQNIYCGWILCQQSSLCPKLRKQSKAFITMHGQMPGNEKTTTGRKKRSTKPGAKIFR